MKAINHTLHLSSVEQEEIQMHAAYLQFFHTHSEGRLTNIACGNKATVDAT